MTYITDPARANVARFVEALDATSTLRALGSLDAIHVFALEAINTEEGEDALLDLLRGPFEASLELIRSLGWEDAETWWEGHNDALPIRFRLDGQCIEVSAQVEGVWHDLYPGASVPSSDYPALLAAYAVTL